MNVGNTNGKVVMQTFSKDALAKVHDVFEGKVPMCYLLWKKNDPTGVKHETAEGYASIIKEGLDNGAHIIGPSISGEPNNYYELDSPWQACLIRRSGMLNHPFTFDSEDQMTKYTGHDTTDEAGEYGKILNVTVPPTAHSVSTMAVSSQVRLDGLFTNLPGMSLRYLIENGYRCNASIPNPFHDGLVYDNSQAPSVVPDASETLQRLGY